MLRVTVDSAGFGNGVNTGVNVGMCCTAVTYSLRLNDVAAMAGIDVNQPRAKAITTGSLGRSSATEHRRLAGGGIGVITGDRRAS